MSSLQDRCAVLLPHLEAAGLAYLRGFANLRSAVENQDDDGMIAALIECRPLLEAWTNAGVTRRASDALWQLPQRPLRPAPRRRQRTPALGPYVPGGSTATLR